ncbi:hypothetical protein HK097_000521 [Rhizophlyctis rosea]|uniref:Uncharacterized protein n=1 Tax=Rhizophlyctis rosea TaxID=64517 RepID=A0AAD5S804_9FUNG|nr:hypothetical protein HK097_000521 [Rhizophlyctis rosea]
MMATLPPPVPSVTLDTIPDTADLDKLSDLPKLPSSPPRQPADESDDERGRSSFPTFPAIPSATRALSPSPSRALSPQRARNAHVRSSSITMGRRRRASTLTGPPPPSVLALGLVGEVKEEDGKLVLKDGDGTIGEEGLTLEYYRRLEEERDMLRMQLLESQQAEKETFNSNKTLKNLLSLRQTELDDSRKERNQLEVSLQTLQTEADQYKRELRLSVKEKTELTEKVAKERAELETLKVQFQEKENNYVQQNRAARRRNRDLQSQTIILEEGLLKTAQQQHDNSQSQETNAQDIIAAKDKEVSFLNEQLNQLSKLNTILSTHLSTSQTENASLKAAAQELQSTNARLMEEAESYQLLLEERTLNGDFLESAFMTRTAGLDTDDVDDEGGRGRAGRKKKTEGRKGRARGMSLSKELGGRVPGSSGSELEDVDEEQEEEDRFVGGVATEMEKKWGRMYEETVTDLESRLKRSDDQLKAVNLYISKILSKLLTDEVIEAALVERVPDDPAPSRGRSVLRGWRKRKSHSVSLGRGLMGSVFEENLFRPFSGAAAAEEKKVEAEKGDGEKVEGEILKSETVKGEAPAQAAGGEGLGGLIKRISFPLPGRKSQDEAEGAPAVDAEAKAAPGTSAQWKGLSLWGGAASPYDEKKVEGEVPTGDSNVTGHPAAPPATWLSAIFTQTPPAVDDGTAKARPASTDMTNVDLTEGSQEDKQKEGPTGEPTDPNADSYFHRFFTVPRRNRSATFAGTTPPTLESLATPNDQTTTQQAPSELFSPTTSLKRFTFFQSTTTPTTDETTDPTKPASETSPSASPYKRFAFFSPRSEKSPPLETDPTAPSTEPDQPFGTATLKRLFTPRQSPTPPPSDEKSDSAVIVDELIHNKEMSASADNALTSTGPMRGFDLFTLRRGTVSEGVGPSAEELQVEEGKKLEEGEEKLVDDGDKGGAVLPDDTVDALKSEILSDITGMLEGEKKEEVEVRDMKQVQEEKEEEKKKIEA